MILKYIPYSEFQTDLHRRVDAGVNENGIEMERVFGPTIEQLAYMHRINALYMIMRAGSGHIGTCFSSAEIMTRLYCEEMTKDDIFLSSKGHDAPLQYSILAAKGIIPFDDIHTFRQPDGLPGHPDIKTPGIVTNTGSLGMGISKGKGLALAKKMKGEPGRVFVLCGDGEMAEGQNWEAIHQRPPSPDSPILIIDYNQYGSDFAINYAPVAKLMHGNNLWNPQKEKFPVECGWQIIIAETKKGQGVSFLEDAGEPYPYHSGALSYHRYNLALDELLPKAGNPNVVEIEDTGNMRVSCSTDSLRVISEVDSVVVQETMGQRWGRALIAEMDIYGKLISLDADLCVDHGLEDIKKQYPEHYIQCGIAEQDMVSTAGGLALAGFIPIVHSFAAFLTRRANEQIYNNCTEGTHIIYVGSLAGPLPSNIGHSHEAFDDIALMKTMPGMTILEPGWNDIDKALRWAIYNTDGPVYIRLAAMPEIEGMKR